MANPAPIYDPDKKTAVTRPDLQVLESGGKTSPPTGNLSVAPEPDDLVKKEVAPADPDRVGRGYTAGGSGGQSSRARLKTRRKLLLGLGAGGVITLLIIGGLFSFLNVFKLDHIMSNIDSRTFARLNGVNDRRSLAWMEAYMRMRLADIGDNPNLDKAADSDNQFFRSERIRENPFTDWYKTMRTSKFEQEVFEKNGFKFVSVRDSNGKIRPGKIILNGNTLVDLDISNADFNKLADGDVATIRKYNSLVDLAKFDNDGQARRAIKKAVKDETRFFEVYKRRHIRKAIQNMTGVRDWRFFENTRNKLGEKKIDIRNKIISKAVPESTKTGKFIKCLFGISDCVYNKDPAAPSNRAQSPMIVTKDKPGSDIYETDENGKRVRATSVDLSGAAEGVRRINGAILSKAAAVLGPLNLVATLDAFSNINKAISNHQLSKGVAIARGVQAMGLYQTFSTARDQLKTGEIQGAELNEFMQAIGPVTASEGWTTVISGGDAPNTTGGLFSNKAYAAADDREAYCSEKHQQELKNNPVQADKEFVYLCPDKQIGGNGQAASLEKSYGQSIGRVIRPLAEAYDDARELPVVGALVDKAVNLFNSVSEKIVEVVLKTTGLAGPLKETMVAIMERVVAFMGAGPVTYNAAGEYMNEAIQGGAYTAEASARANGASLTNPQSSALAKKNLALYQNESSSQMPIFDRYLSISNPESLISNTVFALSQLSVSSATSSIANFSSISKTFVSAILSPFTKSVNAATDDAYRAAEFAGIQTYDFPSQCYDLDPINTSPKEGTNIQAILASKNIPDSELTWELVTNSESWYSYVYKKIGEDKENADDTAQQIYNCNLLDTSIRGSLGFLYGYTKDNGLEDNATSAPTSDTPSTIEGLESPPNLGSSVGQNYYKMPDAPSGEYTFNGGTPAAERCGSKELVDAIYTVSKVWAQKHPQNKIIVGDLNAAGHLSHMTGRDVDIYTHGNLAANTSGSQEASEELGRLFADTGITYLIFYNDTAVQNDFNSYAKGKGLPGTMQYWANHENHFHVRIAERYKLNSITSCP